MEKKTKVEAIPNEKRASIMKEVQSRSGDMSVKDVMAKYGRTEQTYYLWRRQAKDAANPAAPKMATKRATPRSARKVAPVKSGEGTRGVLMPEGRPVRIHTTGTEWAIVTFE